MPTIKGIAGPYRLYFYSFDCNEPAHVHVQRERMVCKFWLMPLALAQNHGFAAHEFSQIGALIREQPAGLRRHGVSAVVSADPRVNEVRIADDLITFHLVDGRVISVPLAWSRRLSDATPAQRNNFVIIGDGQGVHWPAVDEDLSVEGIFYGVPAQRPGKG